MPTNAELEAKIDTLIRQLEEADQSRVKAEKLIAQLETRALQAEGAAETATIESHLRAAALAAGSTLKATEGSKVGPLEHAVRAAMIDNKWQVDSQGQPFRLRHDGSYDYTSPVDVMAQIREQNPRLFPNASPASSEAQGSATGGTTSPTANPWTRAHWNLTKQSEYIAANGSDAGAQLAASVGSSLHATKPPAE